MRPRIIPVLLVRGQKLVKTKQFNPKLDRYLGCPINAARIYSEKGADELIVLDIESSLYNRPPNFELIHSISEQCSMPFCYGGGISNIEQARRIIRNGAEKVSINSQAVIQPSLIYTMAKEFGSQSVVVTIDIKGQGDSLKATYFSGHKFVNKPIETLIKQFSELGCGEFVFNFIDRDGMRNGYDLNAIKFLSEQTQTPFTVVGGVNTREDISSLFQTVPHAAAGVGSSFVFTGPLEAVLINYPTFEQKNDILKNSGRGQYA